MVEKRNIGVCLLLTIFTCGIYAIYWFVVLTDDVKRVSKDESLPNGGISFLLLLLTCGLYSIYWAYMIGKDISKAQEDRNLSVSDNAILYLILEIIGLGIVSRCLIQNDLNNLADSEA